MVFEKKEKLKIPRCLANWSFVSVCFFKTCLSYDEKSSTWKKTHCVSSHFYFFFQNILLVTFEINVNVLMVFNTYRKGIKYRAFWGFIDHLNDFADMKKPNQHCANKFSILVNHWPLMQLEPNLKIDSMLLHPLDYCSKSSQELYFRP